MSTAKNFYELAPLDKTGAPYPFEQLRGKVVLIVNVASKCGFTPQYKELQALFDKYQDKGFVILGFPTAEFANQEFDSQDEISSFCELNFGVKFPILQKTKVNGNDANEVYNFLKNEKAGILGFKGIKWNFEKFLVDKHGKVYQRYSSLTKPSSLETTVEQLLKAE